MEPASVPGVVPALGLQLSALLAPLLALVNQAIALEGPARASGRPFFLARKDCVGRVGSVQRAGNLVASHVVIRKSDRFRTWGSQGPADACVNRFFVRAAERCRARGLVHGDKSRGL